MREEDLEVNRRGRQRQLSQLQSLSHGRHETARVCSQHELFVVAESIELRRARIGMEVTGAGDESGRDVREGQRQRRGGVRRSRRRGGRSSRHRSRAERSGWTMARMMGSSMRRSLRTRTRALQRRGMEARLVVRLRMLRMRMLRPCSVSVTTTTCRCRCWLSVRRRCVLWLLRVLLLSSIGHRCVSSHQRFEFLLCIRLQRLLLHPLVFSAHHHGRATNTKRSETAALLSWPPAAALAGLVERRRPEVRCAGMVARGGQGSNPKRGLTAVSSCRRLWICRRAHGHACGGKAVVSGRTQPRGRMEELRSRGLRRCTVLSSGARVCVHASTCVMCCDGPLLVCGAVRWPPRNDRRVDPSARREESGEGRNNRKEREERTDSRKTRRERRREGHAAAEQRSRKKRS